MLHAPTHDLEQDATALDERDAVANLEAPISAQTATTWSVEIVDTLTGLESRAPEWGRLESVATRGHNNQHSAFQSPAWVFPWLTHIGANLNVTPVVAFIYRDRALAAILPLMEQKRSGIVHLLPLGEPHTQICDAVTDGQSDCQIGLTLALAQITLRKGVDVVALGPMLEGSPLHAAALTLADQGKRREHAPVLVQDPAQYVTLIDSDVDPAKPGITLGKSRRKALRKGMERLSAHGSVSFKRVGRNHPDFVPLVAKALQLKREWLTRNGLFSTGLAHHGIDAFLAGLGSTAFPGDGGGTEPEVEVLMAGAHPVAIAINLVGPAHPTDGEPHPVRQCYLSTYDPAFAGCSPGNLLIHMSLTTQDARQTACLSLLGFPTPQKAAWETRRVGLVRFEQALTRKGALWLDGWLNGLRPRLKQLALASRKPLSHLIQLAKPGTPRKR
ncbi:MAG: GNAT family N-acetyltransferase [Pseudomonadota bacterium]